MATRYDISLPDPERTRASGAFAFRSQGAEGIATEMQAALRGDALFERWRETLDDPDAVAPELGATDPGATVTGQQHETRIDLVVVTSISGAAFKHRLRLLAGSTWEMRDVSAA